MASEITLKYLHPSIKTYITTENYNYDTSVNNEVLFVADVFEHGVDNVIKPITTVSEYLFKYGEPNYAKYGQAGYNIEKWLTNGGTACIMRLLPENASYAHAILNIQYKNSTNGKTVLNNEGNETKIDDVYLRPLVTYIGVNKTSEALLESELAEDRSDYPTTDGYIDNFILAVYPEGRGEYYNNLGFRIRLNPSYDTTLTSRVYTFEIIKYTSSGSYDIIDGPYYVSFDPDAIDPNSQKSMFIENVVNSYSDYVKVKFNTENYIKLATTINDEVDPYIIDVITGQSRILDNGEEETFYSSKTGKEENVHISLHAYSSQGTLLTSNGNIVLNISNNDESSSDIVDIADNSRKVTYNNQYYITQYMRTFYNWLINNKITQNLEKILSGNIESNIDEIDGILKDKAQNLIFNNITNDTEYKYSWNGELKSDKRGSWYTKSVETAKPNMTFGSKDENEKSFSTSEMTNEITEDGYINQTNEHLISYYNNFMKYFQYVINYDIVNGDPFVKSNLVTKLNANTSASNALTDDGNDALVLRKMLTNGSEDQYVVICNTDETEKEKIDPDKNDKFAWSTGTLPLYYKNNDEFKSKMFSDESIFYTDDNKLQAFYYDSANDIYMPIIDFTLYDSNGNKTINGDFVKVYNGIGETILISTSSLIIVPNFFYNHRSSPIYYTIDAIALLNQSFKEFVPFAEGSSTEESGDKIGIIFQEKMALINTNTNKKLVINIPSLYDSTYSTEPPVYKNVVNNRFFQYASGLQSNNGVVATYGHIRKILTIINNDSLFEDDRNLFNFALFSVSESYNLDELTYDQIKNISNNDKKKFNLISLINNLAIAFKNFGAVSSRGLFIGEKNFENTFLPINSLYTKYELYKEISSDKIVITNDGLNSSLKYYTTLGKISPIKYYCENGKIFNESFEVYNKYNKLTQAINKVSSYAGLISKELDGRGKDEINDIQDIKNPNYSDFSLTTIFNFLVGGFEAIVNNQGSITDYSNYASLKYLIKSINNKLDLRSTYLTILNVHKNNVLDLSTELAKNNVSVILGEETLESLYTTLDATVKEINYLITNIILTLLNKTYLIQDLETFYRYDNNIPYARYFSNNKDANNANVDPLGINQQYYNIGKNKDENISSGKYSGILPVLESCLIDLIGQNHIGDSRTPAYGKQPLIDIYNDISGGYTVNGLTQEVYEDFYERLSSTLEKLTSIHSLINAFINEKYITEIIETLVGSLDLDVVNISYDGKNFTVNTLMDYFNQGLDENLTQEKVMTLISNSINPNISNRVLPYEENSVSPIYMYPYFCMVDIRDSQNIANENLDIVKSNILKQDHVLTTLNTLCYDNLTQDINAPIGLAEGSDGDFTYDNSSAAALKKRENLINDIRIKAYKGTWNEDVLNKDLYEFDHVLDANYPDAVKNAIITLARDERQDFFFWADTKKQNTITDCIDWKNGFTNSTYFMSILSQAQVWYDEYSSRNIELTSTYLVADLLPRHITNYGVHYPMAGSRRGVVGGFLSMDWYPNETQKETLYKNKVNYIEKDVNVIRIGSQNTNYPSGPLGSINNMLVLLKIKRKIEKIAKTYQFEFNTEETRGTMNAEINNYLKDWVNNGACTLATAEVYASEYDIMQKIVRVDVILQFTGVIERVVINIDCPAQ